MGKLKEIAMPTKTQLTIRIEKQWIDYARRYAAEHDTTVSLLVADFVRHLALKEQRVSPTPVLDRLSGILSPDVSVDEYYEHLEDKYGGHIGYRQMVPIRYR